MNWTIILSSVAIGSIVAAIISGLLNMLIQDRDYKRDYYKLIISKRITAYQYIETQLNVMKVAVATEGGGYYMMFGNTSNDFFQFQTNLAFALANSLWLSPETINALEKLNEAFFEINDKITDNIVDNIKIGQEYYHQLAKLRIEIENCLKNDMLSLYKVHKFLKLKTIRKDRIFNIAK